MVCKTCEGQGTLRTIHGHATPCGGCVGGIVQSGPYGANSAIGCATLGSDPPWLKKPNERDCEHGRQRGKCADCELAAERLENESLKSQLVEARAALERLGPAVEASENARLTMNRLDHHHPGPLGAEPCSWCQCCGALKDFEGYARAALGQDKGAKNG